MFEIIVFVVIMVISSKLMIKLVKHKEAFKIHGIPSHKIIAIQVSSFLYIFSILGYIVPVLAIELIQLAVILIMLLPGIILGKSISRKMQVTGGADGIEAGEVANNIMWLGFAIGVYIIANIFVGMMIISF